MGSDLKEEGSRGRNGKGVMLENTAHVLWSWRWLSRSLETRNHKQAIILQRNCSPMVPRCQQSLDH